MDRCFFFLFRTVVLVFDSRWDAPYCNWEGLFAATLEFRNPGDSHFHAPCYGYDNGSRIVPPAGPRAYVAHWSVDADDNVQPASLKEGAMPLTVAHLTGSLYCQQQQYHGLFDLMGIDWQLGVAEATVGATRR